MSSAFVKEEESEWLWDVAPNVAALSRYLTRDTGRQVFLKNSGKDAAGNEVLEMSNGLSYKLDAEGKWEVVM